MNNWQIQQVLADNNLEKCKNLEGQNNNLMRAVSLAVFGKVEHYNKIQQHCKIHIKALTDKKKLPKKLENLIQNERWLEDYFTDPTLKCFERLNLELVSLIFKAKIIVYSVNIEQITLKATIYNNGFDCYEIKLFQQDQKNYDVAKSKPNSPLLSSLLDKDLLNTVCYFYSYFIQIPLVESKILGDSTNSPNKQTQEVQQNIPDLFDSQPQTQSLQPTNNLVITLQVFSHKILNLCFSFKKLPFGVNDQQNAVPGQHRQSFQRRHKKSLSDTFNPFSVRFPNDFLDIFKGSNDYTNNAQFHSFLNNTSTNINNNSNNNNNESNNNTSHVTQSNPTSNHTFGNNNISAEKIIHRVQNKNIDETDEIFTVGNTHFEDSHPPYQETFNDNNTDHFNLNYIQNTVNGDMNGNNFIDFNRNENISINFSENNHQGGANNSSSNNLKLTTPHLQVPEASYTSNCSADQNASHENNLQNPENYQSLSSPEIYSTTSNQNIQMQQADNTENDGGQRWIGEKKARTLGMDASNMMNPTASLDFFGNMLTIPNLVQNPQQFRQSLNSNAYQAPPLNLLSPNFGEMQKMSQLKQLSSIPQLSQLPPMNQLSISSNPLNQMNLMAGQQIPQSINAKMHIPINESLRRYMGNLKFFDENKNYGFIVMDDDNRDIFVHYDDLQKAGITKEFLKSSKQGNVIRFSFSCMQYIGKYKQSKKAVELQVMPYNPALSAFNRQQQFYYISASPSTSNQSTSTQSNNNNTTIL